MSTMAEGNIEYLPYLNNIPLWETWKPILPLVLSFGRSASAGSWSLLSLILLVKVVGLVHTIFTSKTEDQLRFPHSDLKKAFQSLVYPVFWEHPSQVLRLTCFWKSKWVGEPDWVNPRSDCLRCSFLLMFGSVWDSQWMALGGTLAYLYSPPPVQESGSIFVPE